MGDIEHTVKAPTIKDLRDRINDVIIIYGEDAEWSAFCDETLHIYNDNGVTMIVIEP